MGIIKGIKGVDIEVDNLELFPDSTVTRLKAMVAIGNRSIYSIKKSEHEYIVEDKESEEELFRINIEEISGTIGEQVLDLCCTDDTTNASRGIPAKQKQRVYLVDTCTSYCDDIRHAKYHFDTSSIVEATVINVEYNTRNKDIGLDVLMNQGTGWVCASMAFASIGEIVDLYNTDEMRRGFDSEDELWDFVKSKRTYGFTLELGYHIGDVLDLDVIEEGLQGETKCAEMEVNTSKYTADCEYGDDDFIPCMGQTLGEWYDMAHDKYLGVVKRFRVDSYTSDGNLNLSIDGRELILRRPQFKVSAYIKDEWDRE